MFIVTKFAVLLILKAAFGDMTLFYDGKYDIRLNGSSPLSGRLEVKYNETWGTVCDDGVTNFTCSLVCIQLGHQNGTCLTHDANHRDCVYDSQNVYEAGAGMIWLDDVSCITHEHSFSECIHSNWGEVNCNHTEDVGCLCTASNNCDVNKHRIVPIYPGIKGIGVVEVKGEDDEWGAVCDDHWTDLDAAVFCRCLGYHDNDSSFKAMLLNHKKVSSSTVLSSYNRSIIIDSVQCTKLDRDLYKNLYDCATIVNKPSKCNVKNELALVKCEDASSPFNFTEKINPLIECHEDRMQLCIQPTFPFQTNLSYAQLTPYCSHAIQLDYHSVKGFCYDIDLKRCSPLEQKLVDSEVKGKFMMCFKLLFHTENHPFFSFELPSYKGCCGLASEKAVETSLIEIPDSLQPSTLTTKASIVGNVEPSIKLSCSHKDFESVTFAATSAPSTTSLPFHNASLTTAINTGSNIYCKVKADVWHKNSYLVARDCYLLAYKVNHATVPKNHNVSLNTNNNENANNNDTNDNKNSNDNAIHNQNDSNEYEKTVDEDVSEVSGRYYMVGNKKISYDDPYITYSYKFFSHKCPVTELLNMDLYNFDSVTWGFSLYLPRSYGHNKVHLSCDVSLCDLELDGKEVCDRSCTPGAEGHDGGDGRSNGGQDNSPADQVEEVELYSASKEGGATEGELTESQDGDVATHEDLSEAFVSLSKRSVGRGRYNTKDTRSSFRQKWGSNFGEVIKKRSTRELSKRKSGNNQGVGHESVANAGKKLRKRRKVIKKLLQGKKRC